MADPFTRALRDATAWTPCDEHDDDDVDKAIERWHVEHDLPCPPDEQFAESTVEKPHGTNFTGWNEAWCERLRVTMPNGNRYWLQVDMEGGGGDDGRGRCTYYNVRNARLGPAPRRESPIAVALTLATIALILLNALVGGMPWGSS